MTAAGLRWSVAPTGLGYGADYYPEQWEKSTWLEDIELMHRAGVNYVSLGVFAWSWLEPEPGRFHFDTFDEIMDLLGAHDISVGLGTATSSPPAWLVCRHPEMRPVDDSGRVLEFGGRQSWCPSSPVYREFSLRLVEAVAEHYRDHPALALWHVSNELGCHNARCYCETSAVAFRRWLRNRYGTLDELNRAWATAFWSQRYTDWFEVQPPRLAPTFPNPTSQLDFARFSDDELRSQLLAERDLLRRITPGVPVTTNFMVGATKNMNYLAWGPDVDVVSNDHYLVEGLAEPEVELAMSADLTRGVARGRSWMLMEQSTSAVNWGTVNRAKRPGEMWRNSLSQVSRGAEVIAYFQWRASSAGAEKFHSAMVPHAGESTRVFEEVVAQGELLARLDQVIGSRSQNSVAFLVDYEAWWAGELDSHPSQNFRYRDEAMRWYAAFWRVGIGVDLVGVDADLSGYSLVIVPTLYLTTDATAAAVDRFVSVGGTALVTYFSGIVDESDHVRLGGYPGAFRDMLGIRTQEFLPLRPGQTVDLSDGSTASVWTEDCVATSAETVLSYASSQIAGRVAVSRNNHRHGHAWYVSCALGPETVDALVQRITAELGIQPVAHTSDGVEVVRRISRDNHTLTFVINHRDEERTVTGLGGMDVLTDETIGSPVVLRPGQTLVVRS